MKATEQEGEQNSNKDGVVAYSFDELPGWFDLDPDVMTLSKKYLDELTTFVVEAENILRKQGVS